MKSKLTIALVVAVLFLIVPVVLRAASPEKIKSFDVEIVIDRSGSFFVTESIVYDFSTNLKHGIFRTIPKGNLDIKILQVTDESNIPWPYTIQSRGVYVEVKIGDPDKLVQGEQVYKISYRIGRGIGFFENHDELYWNVTGTEWDVAIEKASTRISLPEKINEEDLQYACFTGVYGSKEQECIYGIAETGDIYFETTRNLLAREGLTIVLGWPKGMVDEPSFFQKAIWFARRNWPLSIPIFVSLFVFKEWWQKGKDFPIRKPIIAQYEPPDDLRPAEVGTLIRQEVATEDISATIIDLATRGYLKIKETERQGLILKKTDHLLVKLKDFDNDPALKDYEKRILRAIFDSRDVTALSALKDNFYVFLDSIKNKIYKELSLKGHFVVRPDRIKKKWRSIGTTVLIAGFVALFWGANLGIALLASGVLFWIFSFFMPKRTKKGTNAYWQCLGLKEYINTAERYRVQFQEKEKIFEKYLPYAIVFGIAKRWARAFEGIYTTPPSWYEGNFGPTFSTINFSHSLNSAISGMNSIFVSRPGGGFGGGSGFGGGGSSGGGGGGGGGGSW